MSSIRTVPTGWRTVSANVESPSDNGFTPATDWMDAGIVSSLRCRFQMRGRAGNIEVIPAIQFANYERDASPTVTNLGSTWTSANGYVEQTSYTDVSTTSDDKQICRLGWVSRNTSGTAVSACELAAKFEVKTFDSQPAVKLPWMTIVTNSTTGSYQPATDWMNAETFTKFRIKYEVRGLTGLITVVPAYQTADDPANPDTAVSWAQTGTADTISYPTGWQNPSAVADKTLVRFGWVVALSSGSTFSWARIAALLERLDE